MKTIFNYSDREELLQRLRKLEPNTTPQWGQMTVNQMLAHCNRWNTWVLGKEEFNTSQSESGKLHGRKHLNQLVSDDRPLGKNLTASDGFVIREDGFDFQSEKERCLQLLEAYASFSNDNFIHDYFGPMTREEIGIVAYKHQDHHLRQFGC